MKTDFKIEQWKAVPGWDNYSVSSEGRVRRAFKDGSHRILRGGKIENGYRMVSLSSPKRRGFYYVHELVLLCFRGPRPSVKHCAAHRNGVKTDCNILNLRWATYRQNSDDAKRHGTLIRGEYGPAAKLTYQQVLEIRMIRLLKLADQKATGKAYGISKSLVGLLENTRRWGHIRFSPAFMALVRERLSSEGNLRARLAQINKMLTHLHPQ